jgi:type III pantothenate kinase
LIWAIDIGNTRTVSGFMRGNDVMRHDSEPTESLKTKTGSLAWAKRLSCRSVAQALVVSSVVPQVDAHVRSALKNSFGLTPLFVHSDPRLGIPVLYKNPAEVGADRLMNSLAARETYGMPVVVVDYGTATTFDVVDARGRYQGGVILPGIGTSLTALHQFTAKLPEVTFKKVPHAIGRTTSDAMRSGVYHGAVGQTREILLAIRKELGAVAPAVATGGWCHLFKDSELFHRIDPDLTLRGMSIYWRNKGG